MNNIIIKGARENNLKNIDLIIPRNKVVCFVGVSGSGKQHPNLPHGSVFKKTE